MEQVYNKSTELPLKYYWVIKYHNDRFAEFGICRFNGKLHFFEAYYCEKQPDDYDTSLIEMKLYEMSWRHKIRMWFHKTMYEWSVGYNRSFDSNGHPSKTVNRLPIFVRSLLFSWYYQYNIVV